MACDALHELLMKELEELEEEEEIAANKWEGNLGAWKQFIINQNAAPASAPILHAMPSFQILLENGIPDVLRGAVWKILTRSSNSSQRHAQDMRSFEDILRSAQHTIDYEARHAIEKDISRTFPRHVLFETSLGKDQLSSVLVAYAVCDPEVGYCQGMGFIAAFLLCYLAPSDAFWVLHAIMRKREYNLRTLFLPLMPNFQPAMSELGRFIEILMPSVADKLKRSEMDASLFASQWFLTLFVYNMPFEFVAHVWDLFFLKSWPVIYRVAVALLELIGPDLLRERDGDMEALLLVFKSLPLRVVERGIPSIMQRAMQLNLDDGDIRTFRTPQ